MILYHITSQSKGENIKKFGLSTSLGKKDRDTKLINSILYHFKPYKSYLDRNKCIFFRIDKPNSIYNTDILITVDTNNLNMNKLFVCDENLADDIRIAYIEEMDEDIETFANDYFNTMITFEEYIKNPDKYNKTFGSIEILYLGNISKKIIEI